MKRPRHIRANLRFWRTVMLPRIKVNLAVLLLHLLSPARAELSEAPAVSLDVAGE